MSSWLSSFSESFSATTTRLYASSTRTFVNMWSNGFEPVYPATQVNSDLIKSLARASDLSTQVYNFTEMIEHEYCTLIRVDSPVIVGYYEREEETIWIICRGTHSPSCLILDFSWLVNVDSLEGTDIQIPKMIADVVRMEMKNLLEYIQRVVTENRGNVRKLKFTGHSLGGALATALYLSYENNVEKIHELQTALFTFGAPSICVERQPSTSIEHAHHVCYQMDLVVLCPLKLSACTQVVIIVLHISINF